MKFSDICKPSKDLLEDDYTSNINLKAKVKAGPIGVTIETERSAAGTLSSKVTTFIEILTSSFSD